MCHFSDYVMVLQKTQTQKIKYLINVFAKTGIEAVKTISNGLKTINAFNCAYFNTSNLICNLFDVKAVKTIIYSLRNR